MIQSRMSALKIISDLARETSCKEHLEVEVGNLPVVSIFNDELLHFVIVRLSACWVEIMERVGLGDSAGACYLG